MNIITLITDFGTSDAYVGMMKGVILSINPSATIIDINHHVDPQDVCQAAYLIKSAYHYFPKGTVHVVVVDPGVGSGRAIIAFEIKGHIFMSPDNGVLTPVMAVGQAESIVRIENSNFFLQSVSQTFHGRDIFAPVAAHLSMGRDIKSMGPLIDTKDLHFLDIPLPSISKKELVGHIITIDRFGNLITNLDTNSLEKFYDSDKKLMVTIGQTSIKGLSESYESAGHQQPLAIIGSAGYIEIAVNCGSAKEYFKAKKGDTVKVSHG